MWESRTEDPRGRLSTRKWLRAATTLFVAVFGYLLVATTPVLADPAQPTPSQTSQQTTTQTTQATAQTTQTQTNTTTDKDNSSCKVDGVGWIVCSMSRWIADGVDYLYGILSNFFIFTPLATSDDSNSMYQLWSTVRNMANIAFVIAFLVVIYAQITGGFLMSNYTIKRMLPRVIVAAILVNVSYWICAVAIDISNILGVAVQDMFSGFRDSIGAAAKDFPTWQDVTAGILSGTGIAIGAGALLVATGGTVGGLAFLLLGALLPAIFAALVAVAVLAARQALITLFVIIAPLAFVAYLLPNTEDWFNRWRKLFTTMLLMFPAFSLIFGASQVAGVIVIQNAKDITVALLGLTIQVVPLFITPFLIKLSSGLLGTIAGMANNRSKGLFDRTGNWAKANREMHRQRGFSKQPVRLDGRGRVGGMRPTTLAQRLNNRTLRREGLTEAHRAKAAAQFTETSAGRQIHSRRKDAELRQHTADSRNQEAWVQSVYGTPGVAGSGSMHRRQLHHDGHLAAGRAKLIEDGAIAHAERDLQTSIASTGALRDLKIQTNVDNAQAQLQISNVEAEGKLVFRNEVLASRALERMMTQTHEFTKRAELAEAVVQTRSETHWENLALTTPAIQAQRIQVETATASVEAAKKQWDNMLTAIKANESAQTPLAAQFAAGGALTGLDTALRDASTTLAAHNKAAAQNQQAERIYLATQFDDTAPAGPALLDIAQGVRGNDGRRSVAAGTKAERSQSFLDDIKNMKNTMDYAVKTDFDELHRRLADPTLTITERIAYSESLTQLGADGYNRLESALIAYEASAPPADDLQTLKEMLRDNSDFRSAGKHFEIWATDAIGSRSLDTVRDTPGTWTNLSPAKFAVMDSGVQRHVIDLLETQDPAAYNKLVASFREDKATANALKQGIKDRLGL